MRAASRVRLHRNGDTPAGQAVQVARYVLLPRRGLRWRPGQRARRGRGSGVPRGGHAGGPAAGAFLVSLPARQARALTEGTEGGWHCRRYRLALFRPEVTAAPPAAARGVALDVIVVSAADGRPLPGAVVTAHHGRRARARHARPNASRRHRPLAPGVRSGAGAVTSMARFDHWTFVRRRSGGGRCDWCSSPSTTRRPTACASATAHPGRPPVGVRVGLVDTGVDADHPHLVVAGGQNCVTGENPGDHGSNGHEHGTHGHRGRAGTATQRMPRGPRRPS